MVLNIFDASENRVLDQNYAIDFGKQRRLVSARTFAESVSVSAAYSVVGTGTKIAAGRRELRHWSRNSPRCGRVARSAER